MSTHSVTCHIATCDSCRVDLTVEDGGYTPHYDTPTQAVDEAVTAGWVITDTGDLLCHRCWAVHLCTQLGHLWTPWEPCRCRTAIPAHAENGCGLIRFCEQCGHVESSSLADLPTTDEPAHPGR